VLLPLVLLVIAAISAAFVAYGINPAWMQYPHGLEIILAARRFEWPLVALTLVTCVALIALIVAGKKRAWWLLGLAPIVTLLGHRLAVNPTDTFLINSQPMFVSPDHAPFMAPDDWVVGMIDGPDAVAFPYAGLYSHPLVIRNDETEPMLLMWSPFANCATAFRIERSIRPNELEIVAMPGNALLAYNSRVGQFINGVTGLTPANQKPSGFLSSIPVVKTTWSRWLAAHPATIVMAPPMNAGDAPRRAVLPYFPMPRDAGDLEADTTIALMRPGLQGDAHPMTSCVLDSDIGADPLNLSDPPRLFLRNPLTGAVSAFSRNIDQDLVSTFSSKSFKKFPNAMMRDTDSGSAWTSDGHAIDGPMKGKKLTPIEVEDGVYFNVAKLWFPGLKMQSPPRG
jgi:uncharacterized protein DUF3179